MANKMIIDASHPEETRVVVLRGNRVEEFDFESASKRPLRGNIYLAKVTRVEPSLQAAFIDYGGNRHGFLAFSEIHPDYYQIPVADRQALLEEEALSQREEDEEASGERRSRRRRHSRRPEVESRAESGETVSEPAFTDEPGAEETAPATPSANAGTDAVDGEANAAPSARVSEEINPFLSFAPGTGDEAERADAEPSAEPGTPAESDLEGSATTFARAPLAAAHEEPLDITSPKDDAAERDERPVEEDAHEITTLEAAPRSGCPGASCGPRMKASRSSRSAATHWRRFRAARSGCAASTRFRRSSSAGRSCWSRSSRKSAATRGRRSRLTCRWPGATRF